MQQKEERPGTNSGFGTWPTPISTIHLPGIRRIHHGKVREIFSVDDRLLLVATDRLSAFDVVLPDSIPGKGHVLNQLSTFWFKRLEEDKIVDHHLITAQAEEYPEILRPFQDSLKGRSMLVRNCRPLPVECVVRGYLAGSGWKEYREKGSVCGISLPSGLRESDPLPEPIFTPSTKAIEGHDENISFQQVVAQLGLEMAERVRNLSLKIYKWACDYAYGRGIIVCDTKFEFGIADDRLYLIDEVLTPDSSRFWPSHQYQPGRSQPSFDKQYIRDFLESMHWDKTPPAPPLPESVIRATSERYLEAYRRLTGKAQIDCACQETRD